MKNLLLVVSALAIFAGTQASFDIVAWCQGRDYSRNFVQYKANPDNLTEYYQCLKSKSGYSAVKQSCPKCSVFNDDLWQCLKIYGEGCPTEAPITEVISFINDWCSVKGNGPAGEYIQYFKQGSLRYKYIWDIGFGPDSAIELSCAPGTFFSFEQCKCVLCDDQGPCAGGSKRVFTLDFDNVAYQNGIYLDSSESLQYVSDPQGSGKSAQFDGASDIEVPYFQNNEFRQFTLALKFKKAQGSASNQGLVSNGGNPAGGSDFDPPSIYLSIRNGYLVAGIITDEGAAEVQSSDVVSDGEWVSVVFKYDGEQIVLYIGGVQDAATAVSGVTVRQKDDLKFGLGYGLDGVAQYFQGLLDDVNWYQVAIPVPIPSDLLPPN